jgi:hypothetical protein
MEQNKPALDKCSMITIFKLVEIYLPVAVRFKLRYKNSKCYIDCFNFLNNLNGSTLYYPASNPNDELVLACTDIGEDTKLNHSTIFYGGVDIFGYSELDQFKYYFGVNDEATVYEDCNNYGCVNPGIRASDDEDSDDEDSDSEMFDDNESYGDSCRCGESGYWDDMEYDGFYQQSFFGKKVYINEKWSWNKIYTPIFFDFEVSDIWLSAIKMIKERKNFIKPTSVSEGFDISKDIFSLNEKYYEKDLNIYFNYKSS